ncbi:hypothetical protein [Alkalibacillus salilacus]|uniref:Uncharacterized protein n=1 Tax=Alkalibacillus salilacus TaxID=284582 RepID=A0ABT9VIV3_9BACI|nr:hypothetical protein [Alkalibacillus salilacus]MDQ0160775.1 hypothetical protein [Alkalibacillus salilacus]
MTRRLFIIMFILVISLMAGCTGGAEAPEHFLSEEEGKYSIVSVQDSISTPAFKESFTDDNIYLSQTYFSKSHNDLDDLDVGGEELPVFFVFDHEELVMKTSDEAEVVEVLQS